MYLIHEEWSTDLIKDDNIWKILFHDIIKQGHPTKTFLQWLLSLKKCQIVSSGISVVLEASTKFPTVTLQRIFYFRWSQFAVLESILSNMILLHDLSSKLVTPTDVLANRYSLVLILIQYLQKQLSRSCLYCSKVPYLEYRKLSDGFCCDAIHSQVSLAVVKWFSIEIEFFNVEL